MSAQILLLRGINVGGHGKLPMADLRAMLDDLGAGGAKTHLQSGNAVCPTPINPGDLADRIEAVHGFRRDIIALTAEDWRKRIATNPFPTGLPKTLHGYFHDDAAIDTAPMEAPRDPTEALSSHPGVLWLHTPNGFGTSKLASKIERLAGEPMTARNWNTIAAITTLIDNLGLHQILCQPRDIPAQNAYILRK
ncbi:DUF1697 domain-containing protein [Gymnodinialimonas hymeniacidonis]|uniref:DUF1697 domain-containing protein n=1 Tax=Gymnodinialimonas hymeniacidonis TaxID=3126508 RepID=UPI0034C632D2